jgi:hypothetical protein
VQRLDFKPAAFYVLRPSKLLPLHSLNRFNYKYEIGKVELSQILISFFNMACVWRRLVCLVVDPFDLFINIEILNREFKIVNFFLTN